MVESGLIVLCSFISPYRAERDMVRKLVADDEFIEVFVDTPIEDCMQRDPRVCMQRRKRANLRTSRESTRRMRFLSIQKSIYGHVTNLLTRLPALSFEL